MNGSNNITDAPTAPVRISKDDALRRLETLKNGVTVAVVCGFVALSGVVFTPTLAGRTGPAATVTPANPSTGATQQGSTQQNDAGTQQQPQGGFFGGGQGGFFGNSGTQQAPVAGSGVS